MAIEQPDDGSIGVGRTKRCWACSGTKLAQDTGGYDRPCGYCNGEGVIPMRPSDLERESDEGEAAYWAAVRAEEQIEAMREADELADPGLVEGY